MQGCTGLNAAGRKDVRTAVYDGITGTLARTGWLPQNACACLVRVFAFSPSHTPAQHAPHHSAELPYGLSAPPGYSPACFVEDGVCPAGWTRVYSTRTSKRFDVAPRTRERYASAKRAPSSAAQRMH